MNIGRIIKGVGGNYYVSAKGKIYKCSARGKFRKAKITPTVGDYVQFTILDENECEGALDTIEKRKNILLRPRVANIDCAIITFAATSPDINRDLLDRFLILAETQNIPKVIICINKSDLVSQEEKDTFANIYEPYYTVVLTSAEKKIGIDQLTEDIHGTESVFAGPSDVGKTTLINRLIPESNRQTGEISRKIERGKHTTRQVELLRADEETYIVDSPGFTSLSLDFLQSEELENYFREFKPYLNKCRFNDCRHLQEPDCAVKEQVGKDINKERYDSFVSLYEELKQRR